jgi:hypothetical protein
LPNLYFILLKKDKYDIIKQIGAKISQFLYFTKVLVQNKNKGAVLILV